MAKVTLETIDKKIDRQDKVLQNHSKAILDLLSEVKDIRKNMATKKDTNELTNTINKFMKQVDTYYKEMLSLKNKVDRLEKWICLVAEKTGVKLEN